MTLHYIEGVVPMTRSPLWSPPPPHVLLMPDGDRRFAAREGITPEEAYSLAATKVQEFVHVCLEVFGIRTVTVFLTRPATYQKDVQRRDERNLVAITKAIADLARDLKADATLRARGVQFRVAGDIANPPTVVVNSEPLLLAWRQMIAELGELEEIHKGMIAVTKDNTRLNLLVNYSGCAALKTILNSATQRAGDFTTLNQALEEELGGPIGLVVRTGDAIRMSDGPAHQMYQAHFVLIGKLFPEITRLDMENCLALYFEGLGSADNEPRSRI